MPTGKPIAPLTLDQLKELLEGIRAGKKQHIRLGRRSIKVFDGLISAPQQAAVFSISDLATQFNVNASTLSRLARTLGYAGFSEFQEVFRRHIANTGHFYSEQATLLNQSAGEQLSQFELTAEIADKERRNIDGMLNAITPQTLSATVNLLATSQRVRIYGMRQAFAAAVSLSYMLGLVRDDVSILNIAEHGVAHSLAQLTSGDTLVCIGFNPYSRNTVMTGRVAREQGIQVIAITDNHASPLATAANHTFITPTQGAAFSNGLAATTVLTEALTNLVAQQLGEKGLIKLEYHEELLAALQVEA